MTDVQAGAEANVDTPGESTGAKPVAVPIRKRRTGLVVAIIALLLLFGAGGAFAVYRSNQQAEAQKQAIKKASLAADERLDKMWDQMAARDKSWTLVDETSRGAMVGQLSKFATEDIVRWKLATAEIRDSMKPIEDDAVSSAYLALCDEADTMLDDRAGKLKAIGDTSGLSRKLGESDNDYYEGWDLLQDTILSCNAKKWSQADSQSKEAQTLFQNAANTCATVNKTLNDVTVKKHIAWLSAHVELAKMQQELSSIGRRGGVSSYNRQIKKLEAQQATIAGMDGEDYSPGFGWTTAADAGGSFVTGAAKARRLQAEARAAAAEALTQ